MIKHLAALVVCFSFTVSTAAASTAGGLSMTGETMLKEGISPFPSSAFDGGNGTFPDPSGISDMHGVLSPYFTVSGDLGFLKISEIFSIDSIEISETYGKRARISQFFSLDDKASRNDTVSEIRAMVTAAKSSNALASTRACVRGSFVQNGRSYNYETCYELDANGDWFIVSHRVWPIWQQEP